MEQTITLKLDNVDQLIPERGKNLLAAKAIDADYAEYLYDEVNARVGYKSTAKIEIKLPKDKISESNSDLIEKHFRSYFSYREITTQDELAILYRTGRNRLLTSAIGIAIIITLAYLMSSLITSTFILSLSTGIFTVMCWVSIWLPFQTFAFDRWPLRRQLAVYQKLKEAKIQVIPSED